MLSTQKAPTAYQDKDINIINLLKKREQILISFPRFVQDMKTEFEKNVWQGLGIFNLIPRSCVCLAHNTTPFIAAAH